MIPALRFLWRTSGGIKLPAKVLAMSIAFTLYSCLAASPRRDPYGIRGIGIYWIGFIPLFAILWVWLLTSGTRLTILLKILPAGPGASRWIVHAFVFPQVLLALLASLATAFLIANPSAGSFLPVFLPAGALAIGLTAFLLPTARSRDEPGCTILGALLFMAAACWLIGDIVPILGSDGWPWGCLAGGGLLAAAVIRLYLPPLHLTRRPLLGWKWAWFKIACLMVSARDAPGPSVGNHGNPGGISRNRAGKQEARKTGNGRRRTEMRSVSPGFEPRLEMEAPEEAHHLPAAARTARDLPLLHALPGRWEPG